MKIPQILTLIPFEVLEAGLSGNKKSHKSLICSFFVRLLTISVQ